MKETKTVLGCVSVLLFFITLPIQVYMTYLLYVHVNATPLMWGLWVSWIPFVILSQIVSYVLRETE